MLTIILILIVFFMPFGMKAQSFYSTDSTTVYISCDSIQLAATLTMPENPRCAVVLMSGTNQQDRDCNMAGHPVFAEISDYLSSRNIAVLRTDDRGTGKSSGNYNYATTADFAEDAIAAVKYIKTIPSLKEKPVGLIGHSEGGASISIAASKCNDVDFIISLAGLMTDGLSSVIQQNKDIIAATPISDEDKERYNKINDIMFHTAYEYAESDTLDSILYHRYDAWKKIDDENFKKNHPDEYDHFRYYIYMYAMNATSPWYRFFIRYNPSDYLSKVNIPVLALNGDKDVMVNCEQNLNNVKRYLSHNKDVTTKVIQNINHLLLPCKRGTQDEYSELKDEHVSLDVLETIYRWIIARF